MKVIVLALVAVVGLVCARPDDKYTTKYDNVDLDAILANDRLLSNYVNCLLDKGNCTPDGSELKSVIGDALETECSKCNDKQKQGTKKVIRHLIKNKREWWNELEAKYDPSKKYVTKYGDELKAEGITL